MASQQPGERHQAWTHINAADDTSRTLMGQGAALAVGVGATLVAVLLFFVGLDVLFGAFGKLFVFVIAAYFVAAVVHVWLTRAWEGGFTRHELVAAVLFPYDYVRRARRASKGSNVTAPNFGNAPQLCSQGVALTVTIVATVFAVFLFFYGIKLGFGVIGDLILLAIVGYIVGIVVQFWATRAYEDGLTTQELKHALIWPAGAVGILRAGTSRVRSHRADQAA